MESKMEQARWIRLPLHSARWNLAFLKKSFVSSVYTFLFLLLFLLFLRCLFVWFTSVKSPPPKKDYCTPKSQFFLWSIKMRWKEVRSMSSLGGLFRYLARTFHVRGRGVGEGRSGARDSQSSSVTAQQLLPHSAGVWGLGRSRSNSRRLFHSGRAIQVRSGPWAALSRSCSLSYERCLKQWGKGAFAQTQRHFPAQQRETGFAWDQIFCKWAGIPHSILLAYWPVFVFWLSNSELSKLCGVVTH